MAADEGHRLTEQRLSALEQRISDTYSQAANELGETIAAYFESFRERDEEMLGLVGNGEVTLEHYKQWRLNQIARGKRYEALRDKLAERMTDATETALSFINDTTPGIYSLNRNYAAYTIEQISDDADFTTYNEQAVKRIVTESPTLMPNYPKRLALKRGVDLEYGQSQITKNVVSSILQGKGIKKMADDLQRRIADMSRASAIRTARTAITNAQNAGRQDQYTAAANMGIKVKKRWVATLDGRTRHAHGMADGQTVDIDADFEVDGYKMAYPGDRRAPGYLLYNCRCTMRTVEPEGIEAEPRQRRVKDPETGENVLVSDMTYQEWLKWKESVKSVANTENSGIIDVDTSAKTAFIENAPCVTTPKKYTEYFLKPGTRHADQFFDVGYTEDDALQLRYDMARQFDINNAVEWTKLEGGATRFNIYMELGVKKQRTFLTGWVLDTPESKPRIITGFRKNRRRSND